MGIAVLASGSGTLNILKRQIARSWTSSSTADGSAEPAVFSDVASATRRIESDTWKLVLIEANLPGVEQLLRRLRRYHPELAVGLIWPEGHGRASGTAFSQTETVRSFVLPADRDRLASFIATFTAETQVPVIATVQTRPGGRRHAIVGASRAFVEVVQHARRIAPTCATVLVTGESGTGKELISALIHCHSARRENPFVTVNCAALSETLLESELFGHEKGAFTGAMQRRTGHFEQADGGTILLDEISETSRKFQAELLRLLEQQEFKRLGGTQDVRVNVRVIATTNRDLAQLVRKGNFRKDLYYRLGVVRLDVPPLRHRPDDIPALVWHFVNLYSAEAGRRIERLDEQMMELFARHDWPGNVRQLRNVVRAAMLFGTGPVLSLEHVPHVRAELCGPDGDTTSATLQLKELERQAIIEALRRTQRNHAKAARLLGITDRTLREKLRKYSQAGRLGEQVTSGAQA